MYGLTRNQAKALPHWTRGIERAIVFPFRRTPHVLLIGADYWTVTRTTALLADGWWPSNKEGRDSLSRHCDNHQISISPSEAQDD